MLTDRPQWGRLPNGRNFPEAGHSRKTAFGIPDQPCSWPVMGGKLNFGFLACPIIKVADLATHLVGDDVSLA